MAQPRLGRGVKIHNKQALEQCPVFFDLQQRPHARFGSARQLLEYLSGYATFLQEAVARYDGNCL